MAVLWNDKLKKMSNAFAYPEIYFKVLLFQGVEEINFLGIMIRELVCLLLAYVLNYAISQNYI